MGCMVGAALLSRCTLGAVARAVDRYLKPLLAGTAAEQPGAIGVWQRREGLYSSHVVSWRRERQGGILKGLTPHRRGPKSKRNPQEEEMQKLRRENQRLTEELRKAEIVIDVQKKSGRSAGLVPAEGGPRGETVMDAVTHLAPTSHRRLIPPA